MFRIWTDPEDECLDDAKFYRGEEIFERQEFAYELTEPVTKIFNTSLSTSEVPILWKCSNIIPIPKVKQPLCESDTRPISLTPILSKVLEDFVVSWMIEDVGEHIDSRQFGSLKDLPPLIAYSISSTTDSLSLIILVVIWEPASLTLARRLTGSTIPSLLGS